MAKALMTSEVPENPSAKVVIDSELKELEEARIRDQNQQKLLTHLHRSMGNWKGRSRDSSPEKSPAPPTEPEDEKDEMADLVTKTKQVTITKDTPVTTTTSPIVTVTTTTAATSTSSMTSSIAPGSVYTSSVVDEDNTSENNSTYRTVSQAEGTGISYMEETGDSVSLPPEELGSEFDGLAGISNPNLASTASEMSVTDSQEEKLLLEGDNENADEEQVNQHREAMKSLGLTTNQSKESSEAYRNPNPLSDDDDDHDDVSEFCQEDKENFDKSDDLS